MVVAVVEQATGGAMFCATSWNKASGQWILVVVQVFWNFRSCEIICYFGGGGGGSGGTHNEVQDLAVVEVVEKEDKVYKMEQHGTTNTGGGGGGAQVPGTGGVNGGSGIVIIRYKFQ